MKIEDVKAEGSTYEYSLEKLIGKKVKDVRGYITKEFGDPCFKVTTLILEDGTYFNFEGEHDLPYLVDGGAKNGAKFDEYVLNDLYKQENGDDEEDLL